MHACGDKCRSFARADRMTRGLGFASRTPRRPRRARRWCLALVPRNRPKSGLDARDARPAVRLRVWTVDRLSETGFVLPAQCTRRPSEIKG